MQSADLSFGQESEVTTNSSQLELHALVLSLKQKISLLEKELAQYKASAEVIKPAQL